MFELRIISCVLLFLVGCYVSYNNLTNELGDFFCWIALVFVGVIIWLL